MSTLPVLSNTQQTNTKAAATGKISQNPSAGDTPTSQPFGDVLARQLSESKHLGKIQSDANLAETLSESDKTGDAAQMPSADTVTPSATDLLATLLPQAVSTFALAQPNLTTLSKRIEGLESTTVANPATPATSKFGSDDLVAATSLATRPASTTEVQTDTEFAQKLVADKNAGMSLNAKNLTESLPASTAPPAALPSPAAVQAQTNLSAVAAQNLPWVINTPLHQARWADEFSQKITWLATSNLGQHAELHLNPPHLGPLDVVLKVSGDQASALFTSAHAGVREAIELSIPKLRELLADNGIMLGSATVSDQAPREQRSDLGQARHSAEISRLPEVTTTESVLTKLAPVRRHLGVVDTFA